eukprot:5357779-Pyramimonas_sp.AAC.1
MSPTVLSTICRSTDHNADTSSCWATRRSTRTTATSTRYTALGGSPPRFNEWCDLLYQRRPTHVRIQWTC